eukprot:430856_1
MATNKQSKSKPSQSNKRLQTNNELYCYECCMWKPKQSFYSWHQTLCKSCRKKKYNTTTLTGLRFVRKMLCNAKSNSAARKPMTTVNEHNERNRCDLTIEEVFDMLERQKFRCYYSRIPMQFCSNTDWKCSIERLDNYLGYTKDNCVLICSEFNSTDNTVRANTRTSGSGQMNKSKFQQILDKLECLPVLYDQTMFNYNDAYAHLNS